MLTALRHGRDDILQRTVRNLAEQLAQLIERLGGRDPARWPSLGQPGLGQPGLGQPGVGQAMAAEPEPAPASAPPATRPEAEVATAGPLRPPRPQRHVTDLWRAIVDAMPDAAIVLDRGGVVRHHNGLAAEMWPRLRVGLLLSQVSRNPELIEAADRIVEHGGPIEVQLIDHVPVERRIAARLAVLGVEAELESEPALLVSFRDLSEQDRLAQMRADFVANASHELRTPLATLRGAVETLQGPARNDAVVRERFLASMALQAARMTRLIDDLLSLSRVEMRQHLPPRGQVDLNEVTASAVQMLEPLAEAARIKLEVARTDGVAMIRGDREEVAQVLQNLIQNAIKYGREGGHVAVRLSRERSIGQAPARIAVAVRDDGPGIAAEHLPRLTERFYRVNPASSRDKGGTGLGLAIVKHVMNRHRGDLRIQSKVGQGSIFTVVFDEMPPEPGKAAKGTYYKP